MLFVQAPADTLSGESESELGILLYRKIVILPRLSFCNASKTTWTIFGASPNDGSSVAMGQLGHHRTPDGQHDLLAAAQRAPLLMTAFVQDRKIRIDLFEIGFEVSARFETPVVSSMRRFCRTVIRSNI